MGAQLMDENTPISRFAPQPVANGTSSIQPIVLYGHWAGPNPYKVQIILEELGIPFEYNTVEFNDCKKSPFVDLNPNGRLPAIKDPNAGVSLWESGAIVDYLVDEYDKAGKLVYFTSPEKYHIQQWFFFQASGQGPYYGQAVWFAAYHPEKMQSTVDRYIREIERVRGVLDRHLEGRDWLVGDKCSVADLSWAMWENVAELLLDTQHIVFESQYPNYDRWWATLKSRESVRKAVEMRAKGIEDHNLLKRARKDEDS